MKEASYRKHNDRSCNSSTYHKKDGTPIRAILKRETQKQIKQNGKDSEDDKLTLTKESLYDIVKDVKP